MMPDPATPTPETGSAAPTARPLRVMLSLDAGVADLSMLDLAVDVAAQLRGEVFGLLLENEELLRIAAMPFACEIGKVAALERQLQPEHLFRSLRANMRRIESRLADLAQTANVQWSLQVERQRRVEAQWEAEVFDVLVMGRGGLPQRKRSLTVAQPTRQRLLWWLDSRPSQELARNLLGRLALGMALEVYLIGNAAQQEEGRELGEWLEAVGIPHFRLLHDGDLASLKARLAALRIRPDFAIASRSLGWQEISRLVDTLPCPLLVTGA